MPTHKDDLQVKCVVVDVKNDFAVRSKSYKFQGHLNREALTESPKS